jgi:hypothetical protein
MKKILFIAALFTATFNIKAQMSKAEVEGMIKGINFAEIKDIYLIRTRAKNGAEGWSEKSEEFDPKTVKWEFYERSFRAEGASYAVLIPYDKIKIIFLKKASYLTIELLD